MTTKKRLAMIKSAMQTLAAEEKLDNKFKQRGLKSLKEAYAKYTSKENCQNIYK